MMYQKIVSLLLLTAVFALAACTDDLVEQETKQVELSMVSHVAAGMLEQDVFVQGDGGVMRISSLEGAVLDQPIYTAAEFVPHDLVGSGPNPIGPFAEGEMLDMTLGEWLDATGTGYYAVTGEEAEFAFDFSGLFPNAVYTFWCGRTTLSPEVSVEDRPCGAQDGSENIFTTNADGSASVAMKVSTLEPTSAEVVTFIAIAYHSDGQTYGFSPGEFGHNSHVQLFAVVPAPDDVAWEANAIAKK